MAIGHAIAVLGLGFIVFLGQIAFEHEWLLRLWVGLVTLCLLWPIVLALHPGRSVLRFAVFVSLAGILLLPSLALYNRYAPYVFGLPMFVSMNPLSVWKYFSAYQAGRAEAKKDIAAGILAIEEAGFGAGAGSRVRILRERYQIEIRGIAQCIVDEQIVGREAGYNSVSRPEIDRRVGQNRVEEAQEEGNKLDEEERARAEQYSKDLAARFSIFPPDSKIALELVEVWTEHGRQSAFQAEDELRVFVQAVEKYVGERVPENSSPFEFHVTAIFEPTQPPHFETSAKLDSPREVYLRLYNDLQTLERARWNLGRLTVSMDFRIR